MKMRDFLKKLYHSRWSFFAALALIFLLLLFCNRHTAMVADDYRYCFSFADGSRMTSVSQIFPSMAAHRHSMNGRVIAHALVQVFLMLPKPFFNLVNAGFFVLLLFLICRLALPKNATDATLFLFWAFGCIWLLQPEFGQVFLWLDGSVNYLWCAMLCLLWLLPWAEAFLKDTDPSKKGQCFLILFSPLVGAYSENSSVALIVMILAFMALRRFYDKRPVPVWAILSFLGILAGFFFLMLAPATTANKSAEMRLPVLFANFLETGSFYLRFWPLLLCYVLFLFVTWKNSAVRRRCMLSLVFLLGSLAGHFVLTFALYCAGRSTYIGLVLLLCADAVLLPLLFEGVYKKPLLLFCCLWLVLTAWKTAIGVRDILHTDYLLDFNREIIVKAVAGGERDIQVPRPYAQTKYSALEGLPYLNTEDTGDWPNVYMARYYGANSILGY